MPKSQTNSKTNAVNHPKLNEDGQQVLIETPSISTAPDSWEKADMIAVASVTDNPELPKTLNGVEISVLPDAPKTAEDWKRIDKYLDIDEPRYPRKRGMRLTSGCIIVEPDFRVWVVYPTNKHDGTVATFPKGRLEDDISLLTNAVKETYEESGLMALPISYLCDVERTHTITRYYIGRRIGGTPLEACWESQAVALCPLGKLDDILNRPKDRKALPHLEKWMARHGAKKD